MENCPNISKYKIIKKLGDGSYGTVFFVVNNQTGICAAIKKIGKIKEKVIDDLSINNEIDILKKLDHPNIVKRESYIVILKILILKIS